MLRCPLLVLACAALLVLVSCSSLSPSSSPSIDYVVGIKRVPVQARDLPAMMSAGDVTMTAANGKQFRCTIPHTTAPSIAAVTTTTARTPSTHWDSEQLPHTSIASSSSAPVEPPASLGSVFGRIQSTLGFTCLFRTDGWWVYEICPNRRARQFHPAESQPAGPNQSWLNYQIATQFSLGAFAPDTDEWQRVDREGVAEWVYVQHYLGGDGGRTAEARFHCNTSAKALRRSGATVSDTPHTLVRITEPQTHKYEFEIVTPLVCPRKRNTVAAEALSSRQQLAEFDGEDADLALALKLIAPLQSTCLTLANGLWWTYRFCFLDGVSQFHRETKTAPHPAGATVAQVQAHVASVTPLVTVAEFNLGRFVPSTLPSSSSSLATTAHSTIDPSVTSALVVNASRLARGSSFADTYLTQTYSGGDECDVQPGTRRSTHVRFVCQQFSSEARAGQPPVTLSAPALLRATELSTCEYEIVVSVPALCDHPIFAPRMPTMHAIACTEIIQSEDE